MRHGVFAAMVVAATAFGPGAALAQQPAQNPLDVIPDKMPFNVPYGPPISLAQAQAAIQATMDEAKRRGWPEDIAVVGPSGDLVAFVRMDGAQLASIAIAQHKARTAARYRRPTVIFENAVQKGGYNYILSLDDVIASRGGIPLISDGKLIGAIGCSGATGSQDEALCKVGAATVK
ncbi:MAG TPA: heme-binding protein [Acetobacteraceae bacterium]|nr:heme-binding protein [Acetobacteraceae bacterium]